MNILAAICEVFKTQSRLRSWILEATFCVLLTRFGSQAICSTASCALHTINEVMVICNSIDRDSTKMRNRLRPQVICRQVIIQSCHEPITLLDLRTFSLAASSSRMTSEVGSAPERVSRISHAAAAFCTNAQIPGSLANLTQPWA